ncbi:tc5 transposase DNA-binding domain-containing protein [Ditylenchus destructor]|nr:tc5 transposase DNA-binding domain-containing protein [Ditylenchus destructor]
MNASGSDNQNNETPKTKRRSYSVTQKIEVIEFAKVLTHKEACSRFNVDPKSLRRWISMENFLRDMGRSPVLSQLTRIVGRDVQWARIEDELYAWVQMRRENDQKIFLTEVAAEAENILRRHPDCNETFKADSRYVSKFLSRHNIQYDKDTRKRQFKNDSGDDAAFDAVVNNTRGRRPVKQRRASESDSKSLREAAKMAKSRISGNVPKLRNVKLEFAPSSTSLLQSLESNMKEIDKKFQSPNATPRRPLRSKTIARVSVVKNVGIKKEFNQPQYFEDFFDDDDDEVSSVSSDDANYTPTGKARYELRSRPTDYEFRRSSRKRTTRSTAATAVKQTPVKKPRAKSQNKAASSSKSKKQTSQAKKATAKSKTVKQESKCLDAPTTSRERQKATCAKFSPLDDKSADIGQDQALNTTDTPITSRVQPKVSRAILSTPADDRDNPADEEDTQNAEIMHQELQSLLEVARATRSQNPDQGSSSSEAGSIHGQDQAVDEKKIKVARILSLESQAGISHKPVTAGQAGETHMKDSKLDVVDDDEKTQNDKIMQREWQSLLDPAAPSKGHKSYGLESSSSEIDQSDDHSRSVVFDEEVLPNTHVLPREPEQVATSQDLEWSSSDDDLIDEENPRDNFVEKNPPNKTVVSGKYEPVLDLGNATKHRKQGPTSSGTAAIADCDTGVISEERRIQKASPLERHSAFALQSDTTMQSQESSLNKTPQTTDNNGTQKKWKLEFEPVMTIQKPWSPKMMPRFGLEPVMSIQNNVCSSRVSDPFDDENVDDFNKKNTALISTKYGQVFDLQTAPENEDHGSLSPETTAMDDQDQTAIVEEEDVCHASSIEPQSTLNVEPVITDQDQGSLSLETAAMDDQDQTAIVEEEAVCNASTVEPQLTLSAEPVTADQDQGSLSLETTAMDDQDQTAIAEEEAVHNVSLVEPQSTLNVELVTADQDQAVGHMPPQLQQTPPSGMPPVQQSQHTHDQVGLAKQQRSGHRLASGAESDQADTDQEELELSKLRQHSPQEGDLPASPPRITEAQQQQMAKSIESVMVQVMSGHGSKAKKEGSGGSRPGSLSPETAAMDDQDQTAIVEEEAVRNVSSIEPQSTLNAEPVTADQDQGSLSLETTAMDDQDQTAIAEEEAVCNASTVEPQLTLNVELVATDPEQGSLSLETAAMDDQDQTAIVEEEDVCHASSIEPQSTLNVEPVITDQDQGSLSLETAAMDDQDQTAIVEEEAVCNASTVEPQLTLSAEPVTADQDQGSLSLETTAMDDQDQTAIVEEEAVRNVSSVEPQLTLNVELVATDPEQDARIRFSPTSNSSFSDEIDVINIFDDEEEVTSNGTSLTDESKAKFDLKVTPSAYVQKPPAIRTATVEIDVVTIDDLDDPEDVGQTENGKAVSKESHSVLNDSEYSVTGLHDNREDEVFVIIDDFTEGYPAEQNLDIKPTEEELHSSQNSTIPTANQNFQQGSYLASLLGETDEGIDQNSGAAGLELGRKRRSWSVETEPLFLEESRSSLERTFAATNQESSQSFNTLNDNSKGNKGQPQDNSECEYQTKAKNSRKRKQSGPSQTPNKQASKRGQSLCKIAKTKNEEQPHSLGEGEDRKKNNNSRKRKPSVANERQKADIKRAKSCMPRQLPFF